MRLLLDARLIDRDRRGYDAGIHTDVQTQIFVFAEMDAVTNTVRRRFT